LDDDVDLQRIAQATVGLTGADLRNIVNEAALWAARQDKTRVQMSDFDYARDKVLMGAKREEVMQESEKEKTAYHEAGHTLAAWFLPGAQRVHKVTVIPRGQSLGSTQILPAEDKLNLSQREIRDQLVVLLAGRAAEQIIYEETSVGAENDLERATSLARRMIAHWGMSQKLGPVSFKLSDSDPFLGREIHQQRVFSERTLEIIDNEIGDTLRLADYSFAVYLGYQLGDLASSPFCQSLSCQRKSRARFDLTFARGIRVSAAKGGLRRSLRRPMKTSILSGLSVSVVKGS
jgi:cell division protease FtsH